MSPRPTVEVQGLGKLRRSLKQAGMNLDDLKKVHADIARTVAERAAMRAPRRSGALAESIRYSGTNRAAVVRAGYASIPYGGPIHWGWPSRHIKAQPFIYNAAGELHDPIERMYLTALQQIIDDIEGAPGP